jgi:DNA-binding transcriptional ArsR family regulator
MRAPSPGTRLDRTLAALADPTRRGVIDLLRKRPLQPSEIASALSMSRPALSRHLRVLRRAGLVSDAVQADDARARLYELQKERFVELQAWLDEVAAFWETQLGAFKAHAERASGRRAH